MAHGTPSRRIRPWSHPKQAFSRAKGSADDDGGGDQAPGGARGWGRPSVAARAIDSAAGVTSATN